MGQYGINDILKEIRLKSLSEREKGDEFERLMKRWFQTDPRYEELTKVWLWEEFPGRGQLGYVDLGIDLVAKTDMGDYWAIQCKCYAEDATIDKGAIDSFLANASRTFLDEESLQTREFSHFILVSTTRNGLGRNAREAISNLSKPFNCISLFDLEISTVDWEMLYRGGKQGKEALLPGKQAMPHQSEAISKAHKHYVEEGNERGKLIMACGTGKTFTSLKIAENLTDKNALVLLFVPSIALLGQTLNAWMADKTQEMRAICVCSDPKVTRRTFAVDDPDEGITNLAVPATTEVKRILQRLHKAKEEGKRTVIMSTYQSIDVVAEAMREAHLVADLCICDEAHRTTGVKLADREETHFVKVHRNETIPAKKRLYMTATPRLYRESAKIKAKENDCLLCSMDDETLYGKEFHRLSFHEAVSRGLLTDYKVLVLTVSEEDIPSSIQEEIKKRYAEASEKSKISELHFDDATKLIGCINGLSKRIRGDDGVTREEDPTLMKRAVAFCQTINPTPNNPMASSKQISGNFERVCQAYKSKLSEDVAKFVVNTKADHIDGTMDANTRSKKIAWLKEETDDPNECRILCNVRCLSEGVDVPALDAVLFLSPRNSEVEVVQSVGRVMRTFGKGTDREKKYGYIIIPVVIPPHTKPEEVLNNNERFKVVWTILNALRSHDENFNAHVNQINLNRKRSGRIVVGSVPREEFSSASNEYPQEEERSAAAAHEMIQQWELFSDKLQADIYARLVEKVGDKLYWEQWAKQIGEIAKRYIQRIAQLVNGKETAREQFDKFVKELQESINPSIDEGQAIEMLAQHLITRPVFDALFKEYQFVNNNIVSRSMECMMKVLEGEGFEMDSEVLAKFYDSVQINVGNIDNLEGKQTIIKDLYEKFFKGAFPLTVEKLGIVYTPVECVDFIIRSVDALLHREFNTALTRENVHILDPFTGTGTFITRMLQLGVIKEEDMERKYLREIHCNEIVLLAYYIADVNIESVYHECMHPESYLPYEGICLTDTFQLAEAKHTELFTEFFQDNSERVKRQKAAPVRVIIGNPPYSVGQKSANDNAQNQRYPQLDRKIADTYVLKSDCKLNRSTYDTYIKAFRWASDRISEESGGIVAFISNGAWIDGNAQDGMRRCIEEEFSSIYVFNLRGNQRTSGELSRREGGKIFGSGSRTPIAITFLVKNPARRGEKAEIYYYDIGDYLRREEKLKRLKTLGSIESSKLEWRRIRPNEKGDWINLRDGLFDTLIPLTDNDKKNDKVFFKYYSRGVATARDRWCYNSSHLVLSDTINKSITFYNDQVDLYSEAKKNNPNVNIEQIVNFDPGRFSWDRAQKSHDLPRGRKYQFKSDSIRIFLYRPFFKQMGYFDRQLNNCVYQMPQFFPTKTSENIVICTSGPGSSKDFSCIISSNIVDLELIGKSQCFPLYWYKEREYQQRSVFDTDCAESRYEKREGISDWILKEVRLRYRSHTLTKRHIFYYVYGLLHSPDYRLRFAADLKKSPPRIPLVERIEDFMDFYKCGLALANLHLHYEEVEPCEEVVVSGLDLAPDGDSEEAYAYFRIADKLRFESKEDKSVIIYNDRITLSNIPSKAYGYVVNGKSAIEWIVDRYGVSVDRLSHIRNDCNDWAREHRKPRYVLDLLLSVINISVKTVDIVNSLPRLKFDWTQSVEDSL